MSRFLATSLALLLCGVGSALLQGADKDDAKSTEGTWEVTKMTVDGTAAPKPKEKMLLIIKDNTYKMEAGGKVIEKGTFKIDTSKTPYVLDIMPEPTKRTWFTAQRLSLALVNRVTMNG